MSTSCQEARETLQEALEEEAALGASLEKRERHAKKLMDIQNALCEYGAGPCDYAIRDLLRGIRCERHTALQENVAARRTLDLQRRKTAHARLKHEACVLEQEVGDLEAERSRGPATIDCGGYFLHAGALRPGGHVRVPQVGVDNDMVLQVKKHERKVRFEEDQKAYITGENDVVAYHYFQEVHVNIDHLYSPAVLLETGGFRDHVPADQLPTREEEMDTQDAQVF